MLFIVSVNIWEFGEESTGYVHGKSESYEYKGYQETKDAKEDAMPVITDCGFNWIGRSYVLRLSKTGFNHKKVSRGHNFQWIDGA